MRSFKGVSAGRNRLRRSRLKGVESLEDRRVLAAVPVISEVLASNDRVIVDEDGEDSDYVELYNAGDDGMSLNRYYLTDDPENLQKWRFPDVDLGVGEYLVVFASGNDRNDPDSELHSNFRLSSSGEYLALVEPDGQTVAFEIGPAYPQQVTDVSYGIPTGIGYSNLLEAGASAKLLVPTNGSLEPTEPDTVVGSWLDPEFNDTSWTDVSTGVGYIPPNTPMVLADSVTEFSGIQGLNNWRYGTWAENFDSDKIYAASEFGQIGDSFFNLAGPSWDITGTTTQIDANGASPASGFFTNWAIRRWISETSGEVTISGTLGNAERKWQRCAWPSDGQRQRNLQPRDQRQLGRLLVYDQRRTWRLRRFRDRSDRRGDGRCQYIHDADRRPAADRTGRSSDGRFQQRLGAGRDTGSGGQQLVLRLL